jgi:hypothetical protein
MRPRPDDEVSWAHGSRSLLLTGAIALAVIATAAAFLTSDPRLLRGAVVLAAWGAVAATVVAVRRRAEKEAVLAREAELCRAYERELDLEAAARREFELELENELRHRTEDEVEQELGYLRQNITALDRVREEVARLGSFAGDLSSLASLRAEITSLSALRNDVSGLAALRDDLGQLGELRADLGRMRAEIIEQLNGEMLVERIVMRTQATRRSTEPEPPSREVTGGWAAVRLDDPGPTREYEQVRPVTSPSRHVAADPQLSGRPQPAASAGSTVGSTAESNPFAQVRPVPYRRRRTDEPDGLDGGPPTDPAEAITTLRPLPSPPPRPLASPPPRPLASPPPPPYPQQDRFPPADPAPETDGHARLAEILAESGARPPSGRRRRRYREDGEPDDVLARVLGQQ